MSYAKTDWSTLSLLQRRTAEITVDSEEQNAVFVRISGKYTIFRRLL